MRKFIISSLLMLVFTSVFFAQTTKQRAYLVPAKFVSMILIADPKCPIQLDDPKYLRYDDGSFRKAYTIVNRSDKPILRFRIKELSWFGNQENSKESKVMEGNSFDPYESFSNLPNEDNLDILPGNEQLFDLWGIGRKPKDIWLIMVTKVELSDGTAYDESSKYRIIEKAVRNLDIGSRSDVSEINKGEAELKRIIRETIGN